MKYLKRRGLLAAWFLALSSLAAQEASSALKVRKSVFPRLVEVAKDFMVHGEPTANHADPEVFWAEGDIDGDGTGDLLTASSTLWDEAGGDDTPNWTIRLGRADGSFASIEGAIKAGLGQTSVPFRPEWFRFDFIPEVQKNGILYLICGRGGHARCKLEAVVIDRGAFEVHPLGEPVEAETNFDRLLERITAHGQTAVHRAPVADILALSAAGYAGEEEEPGGPPVKPEPPAGERKSAAENGISTFVVSEWSCPWWAVVLGLAGAGGVGWSLLKRRSRRTDGPENR